jgi:hypothetical protein
LHGALVPGATCSVDVVFMPTSAGSKYADLSVSANPGGLVTALMDGMGMATGAVLDLQPTSVDFGAWLQRDISNPITFTLKNVGGSPSSQVSVRMAGKDPGDFPITNDSCTIALVPGQTCHFDVQFAPQTAGQKNGTVIATSQESMAQSTVTGVGQ